MNTPPPPGLDLEFLHGLRLLYVEDEDEVRDLLSRFLGRRVGNLEVATNGKEGLERFLAGEYDVVVTDIKMPEMDGLEMATRIKATGQSVPIIVVTAYSDRDYLMRAIDLGVDRYVTKPIDPDALLTAIHDAVMVRSQQKALLAAERKVGNILQQTVMALARAIEMRDPYTDGHQKRVSVLAEAIAKEMELPANVVEGVRFGGLIHDIGSIRTPSEILCKPGKLKPIEFEIIKNHSQAGYELLKDVDFPWPIAEMVRQHHERLNGSGYPQHLKGDAILLESRILAVADVVEAMSSHRPYRPALGLDQALAELESGAGILYDPVVVTACKRLMTRQPDLLPSLRA